MKALAFARKAGITPIVIDFRRTTRAYPDAMIPILCAASILRREGIEVRANLPTDPQFHRLFTNTNWAHFLDPERYAISDTEFDRHLATQRFVTSDEQQAVVDKILEVVMGNMSISRDILDGLEWSVNEVTDNVLNHAQSPDGGFVQVTTYRDTGTLEFVVGDVGRGILASMQEGFPQLRSDKLAIGEAVKAGVTRNKDAGQGNGLAGSLRIATLSGGSFAVTSGDTQLLVRAEPNGAVDSQSFQRGAQQYFQGTLVTALIRQNPQFDMSEALAFPGIPYSRFDIIDAKYQLQDSNALSLRLADETTGFGTRSAGRQVRTKCLNLLRAAPDKMLVLNWDGVPVISSSFADEAIGKLFVELGPTGFMARLRNICMEKLVRILVDKAIMQRTAQMVSGLDAVEEGPL